VADLLNKDIYIRPHIDFAQGVPNPEFGIGSPNIKADLKTMDPESKNFFKSRMRSAAKQGCKYVVANIDNFKGNVSDLSAKIKDGFEHNGKPKNKNIERVIVIRNDKAVQLTRKQVGKDMFPGLEDLL
jgi:hypothetical protein